MAASAVPPNPMNSKKTLVTVLLATGALALVGLCIYSFASHNRDTEVGPSASDRKYEPASSIRSDAYKNLAPPTTVEEVDPAQKIGSLLAQYKCVDALQQCGQDPFVAESEAEAQWLRRNGYPTQQQLSEARSLSAAQLRIRADRGNLADKALYAEKLAEEGHPYEALRALGYVVTNGSTYALYSTSNVYASKASPLYNPKTSRAYLRLAYLAGDSKATYALATRFPEFDSMAENLVVDKRASDLHRTFLKGRSSPRP